jgi:hypothetical protein
MLNFGSRVPLKRSLSTQCSKFCTYLALTLCSQSIREPNRFHVASYASFHHPCTSVERLFLLVANVRHIRHPNLMLRFALRRGAGGRTFCSTASDTGDAVVFDALPGARGPFGAAKLSRRGGEAVPFPVLEGCLGGVLEGRLCEE